MAAETKPTEPSKLDVLRELLGWKQKDVADSAAWISAENQLAWNKEMRRSNRWHQEQVNARQRALGCEAEHIDCGDDMSPTLINCNFQGDETVAQLAKALNVSDNDSSGPYPPPVYRPPRPFWQKLLTALLLLGAVLLGALLIWLTLRWYGDPGSGGSDRYEIIALPFDPNT